MSSTKTTPAKTAREIRRMLKNGGSAKHAKGVQWFFKEEIQSHGWRTAALRKAAIQTRKQILKDHDLNFLIQVADQLFCGRVLEEKIFAVFLLEKLHGKFDDTEFFLLESWLPRISSWADHDSLVSSLIGKMIVAKPFRTAFVFRWAKSEDRWHRRAACVALIPGIRKKLFCRRSFAFPIFC